MIAAFFGHLNFQASAESEVRLFKLLQERIGDKPADIFLGEYGIFDSFAYNCCIKYKETHPCISLIFVTPYLDDKYQKRHMENRRYDTILYPL